MGRDAKLIVVDEMRPPAPAGSVMLTRGPDGKISGWNHGCPCGCGGMSFMGLDPRLNVEAATWQVTGGSLDDPATLTLAPSIGIKSDGEGNRPASGYHWHGFLENGVFVEK